MDSEGFLWRGSNPAILIRCSDHFLEASRIGRGQALG
jgi:hypothetical protein